MVHPADDAIRSYWERRISPGDASWGHVGSLVRLVLEKLTAAGVNASDVRMNEPLVLPGSYGINRRWDLVVAPAGIPVAAVEIVVQDAGSASKNFGNRTSDILSRAADVDRQFEAQDLGVHRPRLGLLYVQEQAPDQAETPHGTAGRAADGSVRDRYAGFFGKLLADGKYDAICYLTATPPGPAVGEPREDMSFAGFIEALARGAATIASLNEELDLSADHFGRLLALRDDLGSVLSGLTSTQAGLSAAERAVVQRRRQTVRELIAMAVHPDTSERRMHGAIGRNYWLFGGQYTGIARQDLMPLDRHDIPLVCADGSLEIVELKGPGAALVKRHRSHLIVSGKVHDAVSQCIGYLRMIDEAGATLQTVHRNELGLDYDYRRARGVVVIGHPGCARNDGVSREDIDQTIRSYNAHLSRVKVITYADLLESAERTLRFETESDAARPTGAAGDTAGSQPPEGGE
jgi:antiviral defense system Shedu protein SduA/restriction endonuclease XhoI-like protein